MKRFLSLFALATVAAFAQRSETVFFRAVMLPSNEVPAVTINGQGTATIRAHVMRDASGQIVSGSVDFIVNYTFPGAMTFTGLHIHRGVAGENGPVTINTGIGGANGNVEDPAGRGTVERQAQVRATDTNGLDTLRGMMENPAGYYVNIHSTVNPGGVIRGQLMRPEVITLMGNMSPRNEVPAIANSDASGVGSIVAMRTFGDDGGMNSALVIFEIDYAIGQRTTLTGLHIHTGPAGVNGPVVINTGLANLPSTDSGSGRLVYNVEVDTSRPANVDVVNGLFANPAEYYVNMHTTEAPGGLIRSQLRRPDRATFQVEMSPRNEVPAITGLDAAGVGNVHINTLRGNDGSVTAGRVVFDVNYRFPDEVTFTGLHVHNQAAGQNGPVTIDSGVTAANNIQSPAGFGNVYRVVNVSSATGLATLNSLVANPQNHYVNLHTTVNPGGAVRAQLAEGLTRPPAVGDATSLVLHPGQRNVAQGGLMAIFGDRFGYFETDAISSSANSLPDTLNGVAVSVGGRTAPIVMAAPGQINVQVPFETPAGRQPVVVKTPAGDSAPFMATVAQYAPAIFLYGDEGGGQVVRVSDVSWITSQNPARAGDMLAIWSTGLGQTIPPSRTGVYLPEAIIATVPVIATIAGRPAPVVLSVAQPGMPGLYVTFIAVPPGLPAGNHPLQLRIGEAASNAVTLAVR